MAMSRKDYVAIAAAIQTARNDVDSLFPSGINFSGPKREMQTEAWRKALDRVTKEIARELKADNGRFDRERFFSAAGLIEGIE